MVDPKHFTNFSRSDVELEEAAIFALLVSGKKAVTTAKHLDKLLRDAGFDGSNSPFAAVKTLSAEELPELRKNYGFGCFTMKSRGLMELVNSGLNLRTCTCEDLEEIYGISYKTSRFFILHSRPDQTCVPLDTHNLAELRELGYKVPS
ncbi:MAG: hypothetical protein ACREGR_04390, partial [Minisyncoccia bacterium]